MQREYKGFIFTKHALERISSRSITQDAVVKVLQHPEITEPTDKPGNTKFIKTVDGRLIHVVATLLPQPKTWLVISVWVRGETDKIPVVWQLLSLPFRLIFKLLKYAYRQLLH